MEMWDIVTDRDIYKGGPQYVDSQSPSSVLTWCLVFLQQPFLTSSFESFSLHHLPMARFSVLFALFAASVAVAGEHIMFNR
jgi:hypothetical protein